MVDADDKENDPGLKEKIEQAKVKDEKEKEDIEAYLKTFKDSEFAKIYKYNHPVILIFPACFLSACTGFTQPFLGIIFAKVMNLLTIPAKMWEMLKGPDYL